MTYLFTAKFKIDQQFKTPGKVGGYKRSHTFAHQQPDPSRRPSEGPYIGMLSIHRNTIHTSENGPYIGASMYGHIPLMYGHVYTLPEKVFHCSFGNFGNFWRSR